MCLAPYFVNTSIAWLPKRGAQEKEHQTCSHDIIVVESSSTRKLEGPKAFTCNNPSKRARISISMAKPQPASLENVLTLCHNNL